MVEGWCGSANPPPQAVRAPPAATSSNRLARAEKIRLRRRKGRISRAALTSPAGSGHREVWFEAWAEVCCAAVWMVIVEEPPALPGVTDVGEKTTVAPAGTPLADKDTAVVKLPLTEPIATW